MSGKIILVGAGPGDAGLFTIKGRRALLHADVVVYDRLVGREVLAMVPEGVEMIDVGKDAGNHKVPQWRINEILVEKALEGKTVVRLKGGDPFLFGRGGEELELPVESGIDFEVIPGVTSAIAVPAYGGIPVTHRDFASSIHIITGHAKEDMPLDINFDALVQAGGTMVFLMGVSSLERICAGLLEAGMPGDTPVAVIEKGSTPFQRKVVSVLTDICARTAESGVKSPAVIIVGAVAALSDKFDWFSHLPLNGRTVAVTRPKERAGRLAGKLRDLGANVVEYPCIETVERVPCPELEAAVERIRDYEWLTFTSAVGVVAFFHALDRMKLDARALGRIKIAVIGPGTAKELKKFGLRHDLMPDVYDTENLVLALSGVAKGKVLICRAADGTPLLTEILQSNGVEYSDVKCYDTLYRSSSSAEMAELLARGEKLFVTFTSASTVSGFVSSLGKCDMSAVIGCCIGRQTAAAADKAGIKSWISEESTIDSLIELIKEKHAGLS